MIAHDIAGDWELYNTPIRFSPKSRIFWECMGYSRTGYTIRFARLEPVGNMQVKQINCYVSPDKLVYL